MRPSPDPSLAFPDFSLALFDGAATRAELSDFVARFEAWRARAVARLSASEGLPGVSRQLCDLLLWTLDVLPPPPLRLSAWRVRSLPRLSEDWRLLEDEALRRRVLDLLAWRAAAADFLSDIWDLTGIPVFDVIECGIASATLLTPASRSGSRMCPYCLQPTGSYSAAEFNAHLAQCPINRAMSDLARRQGVGSGR